MTCPNCHTIETENFIKIENESTDKIEVYNCLNCLRSFKVTKEVIKNSINNKKI